MLKELLFLRRMRIGYTIIVQKVQLSSSGHEHLVSAALTVERAAHQMVLALLSEII